MASHVAPFYYPSVPRGNCQFRLHAVGSRPNQMGSNQGRPNEIICGRIAQQRTARSCRSEVRKMSEQCFLRGTSMNKMHASSALTNRVLTSAWNPPMQVLKCEWILYQLLILKENQPRSRGQTTAHVHLKGLGPLHNVGKEKEPQGSSIHERSPESRRAVQLNGTGLLHVNANSN
jgi:hypothetical protein